MLPVRVVVFCAGLLLAFETAGSAVQTFVVPRALPVRLPRLVFRLLRIVFTKTARSAKGYEGLDRRMAFYAPTGLLLLPALWLGLMLVAFAAMIWAVDECSVWVAVETSGSSLLTLGFRHPGSPTTTMLSFVEGATGIALLALLITYLPTIYGAFTRRETLVSLLDVRAGTPPWAVTMIERYQRIGLLDRSDELFERAELWFADIEESHTSLASLAFFRSPQPDRSWVAAAGTILDCAALSISLVDVEGVDNPHAALCIRSGYLALRRIADVFGLPYDPDPAPTDPISISRAQFDEAVARLAAVGTPMKADLDQAWRDFAGWRVNYDAALRELAVLTLSSPAPWLDMKVHET